MACGLRAFAAISEDPSLIPSIRVRQLMTTCKANPRVLMPPSGLCGPHIHVHTLADTHAYTWLKNKSKTEKNYYAKKADKNAPGYVVLFI